MSLAICSEAMHNRLGRHRLNAATLNPDSSLAQRLRNAMDYLEKRIQRECEHDLGPILNLPDRSVRVCIYCGHEADCDY